MVNAAYAVGEAGLWAGTVDRTDPDEVARLTRAGELAVAERDGDGVAGCVRVRPIDDATSEFGMLAADPLLRGRGVGRELVRFVERTSRTAGRSAVQLQLLVPRAGRHPVKEFLAAWYARMGYRIVEHREPERDHPGLAPLLAGPSEFLIFRKQLDG